MPSSTATGRLLYPDVALSRSLARCSMGAQLLFDRLIALADDQGRQVGDAEGFLVSAFPRLRSISEDQVAGWLDELVEGRLVIRYADEAEGRVLLQLRGWWEWQRLEWARASRYPAPEGWSDRLGKRPSKPTRPDDSGPVRTDPDPSPQNQKENQKENQKPGLRTGPEASPDGRTFREKVGPVAGLGVEP